MSNRLHNKTDEQLYHLMVKRNKVAEEAFAILYERHSQRIYAYCRRFLDGSDEANDVFQETFVRFYKSASADREMTNLPAYLLRIARNLCVNAKRKHKDHSSFEEYMVQDFDDHQSGSIELLELIKKAMSTLDDKYREMFILREYEGMSYSEIAEATDESVSTVKVRIFRAKQKIREYLAPYIREIEKYH